MIRSLARTRIYAFQITGYCSIFQPVNKLCIRNIQRTLVTSAAINCITNPVKKVLNGASSIPKYTDIQVDETKILTPSVVNVNSEHNSLITDVIPDWTIQELYMNTGAELWDDWPEGAQFIVGYIDTAVNVDPQLQSKMATILAVAGGNGCHDDLLPLLRPLAERGFRIIIPCLLGTSPTRGVTKFDDSLFSDRLGERSAFLLDFISVLGITRCDIAIGHSHGCFPLTVLASNYRIFNSVALVCPIPGHTPSRMLRPRWLTAKMVEWSSHVLLRPLAYLTLLAYYGGRCSAALPAKHTVKDTSLLLRILHGINYDMLSSFASVIEARRVPLLYVHCDSDPVVDTLQSDEYSQMFGITHEQTDVYDEHGTLASKGKERNCYSHAVRFTHKTHCPMHHQGLRDVIIIELLKLHGASKKIET